MSKMGNRLNEIKAKYKYLSKKEQNSIKKLKNTIDESKILVICMGLYNHGKSTLLNTLINDFEHKTFKTADIRETSQNKKVAYEDIIFVDTPGLNAQESDDKRVLDVVKESDINLFVHNVTTGEFTKKEIEFLLQVKKHWKNPQEFIDRTIFVLSRVDGAEDSDVLTTQKRMQDQIVEIFECSPSFVAVSAKSYTKGMLEDKKLLIKKSNIKLLSNKLYELKDNLKSSILETKKERLRSLYDSFIVRLNTKVQTNALEISQLSREKKKLDDAFDKDIKNIKNTLLIMSRELGEV